MGGALAAASCARDTTPRPNLLLVTVDTLRADHLGSYGYRLPTSPHLDHLASQGIRFADATVPWPKTWPAIGSLLTGKYPATTGVRLHPRRPLPAEHDTLAEILGRAGYATAAVVANVNVGARYGYDQGFDAFVEAWREGLEREGGSVALARDPGAVKRYVSARTVTDHGLELLERLLGSRPFFLWLHYLDPHGPYRPPEEYARLWADSYEHREVPFTSLPRYQRQRDERGRPISDLAHYVGNYDREIRSFDDQLGRLLRAVDRWGLRGETLIVVTADHGESLGEDGYYLEHGAAPYQPCAAVPLVLAWPGRLPAGRVVTAPVGLVDLLPTVLDLLGLPPPASVQGESLEGAWRGLEPSRYVFMESGSYEPSQLSVRKGPWKLTWLRSPRDRRRFGRSEVELYDLESDPDEEVDRSADHPDVVRELRAALERWSTDTPVYEAIEPGSVSVDPGTRDLLRALGYVDD